MLFRSLVGDFFRSESRLHGAADVRGTLAASITDGVSLCILSFIHGDGCLGCCSCCCWDVDFALLDHGGRVVFSSLAAVVSTFFTDGDKVLDREIIFCSLTLELTLSFEF